MTYTVAVGSGYPCRRLPAIAVQTAAACAVARGGTGERAASPRHSRPHPCRSRRPMPSRGPASSTHGGTRCLRCMPPSASTPEANQTHVVEHVPISRSGPRERPVTATASWMRRHVRTHAVDMRPGYLHGPVGLRRSASSTSRVIVEALPWALPVVRLPGRRGHCPVSAPAGSMSEPFTGSHHVDGR
jgi:hypothetical protein